MMEFNTTGNTDNTDTGTGNTHQIAFFCHGCNRSFLGDRAQCPHCQGEFVECIADHLGLAVDIDLLDYDDDDDDDYEDVDLDTDGSDGNSDSEDSQSDTQSTSTEDEEMNDPLHRMLTEHLRQHRRQLRQHGIDLPQISEHMAAVARTINDHFSRTSAASAASADVGSGGTNTNDTNDTQDSAESEGTNGTNDTVRIQLADGREMVVIMADPLLSTLTATSSTTTTTPSTNTHPQHPLLRLLGYHGDPRDYVNDPHRFATLLDRLFQSHSATGPSTAPMSPADISALKRRSSDADAGGGGGTEVCPVCMEQVASGVVVEMPCGHEFHEQCIVPWLQRTASCPVCRAVPCAGGGAGTGTSGTNTV